MRRENRIVSSRDFGRIMGTGRRVTAGTVVCFAAAAPSDGGGADRAPRVGVIAGRKVGGAVQRNRAKRLLREAARRKLESIPPGAEVVFLATPAIAGKSFQEVLPDVERGLAAALERVGASPGGDHRSA